MKLRNEQETECRAIHQWLPFLILNGVNPNDLDRAKIPWLGDLIPAQYP